MSKNIVSGLGRSATMVPRKGSGDLDTDKIIAANKIMINNIIPVGFIKVVYKYRL